MKWLRVLIIALLFTGIAYPQTADAQFWKKAKKKLEDATKKELNEKADEKLEQAAEEGVELAANEAEKGLENAAEAFLASFQSDDVPESFGPNANGPLEAPLVQYRSTSTMQIPGMSNATGIGKLIANQLMQGVSETVTVSATRKRTDNKEQSTIFDAENGRYITLFHPDKTYSIWTIEDMTKMMEENLQQLKQQPNTEGNQSMPAETEQPQTEVDMQFNFSAERTGLKEVINGTDTEQVIAVMETQYDATNPEQQGTMSGKFYAVMDTRRSEKLGGYQTIQAFERAMAEKMGAAIRDTDMGAALTAMGQDPRMKASLEEIGEQTSDLQDVPGIDVFNTTYFVLVPKDQELNLERVLNPAPGSDQQDMAAMMENMERAQENGEQTGPQQQTTLTTTITQISDLTTTGIDPNYLEIPSDYTQRKKKESEY